ncbi:MAG: aldehyde dehydrogenase family protein [Candidatus Polarisedimenticolia bacterium]
MTDRRPFIAGEWVATNDVQEIRSPYSGKTVTRVHRARAEEVERSIESARRAAPVMRELPAWRRSEILEKMAAGVAARRDDFARLLALEAGKPLKAGRAEVDRAVFTLRCAGEEARRMGGELIRLDWAPWGEDRLGITRRFPLGVISAITPFNFPLNLVAHKVAPAIASGNALVLKPASQTPSPALELAGLAHEAALPPGALNVLPASSAVAAPLVSDDRFAMVTFTGSASVGWDIKKRAGKKKVTLELGGNAAVIVHGDADLERAAERITAGGFGYAGQSCISVQRVFVQRGVHARFLEAFVPRVAALVMGDPLDDATDVGPLITEADARRVESWIDGAVAAGARLVTGGRCEGAMVSPTVLDGVHPRMKVSCEEVFAPVVAVSTYDTLDEAIGLTNDSRYGLQAGLFTRDAPSVWKAFERLEVGAVMIDEVPTFRIDHMPYGGVKDSGMGREGLRYSMEEMTELRLLGWHISRQ